MAIHLMKCMDYQDIALIEIGNQKCTPLYSFGPFIRTNYIFHYVISGKGYVSCKNHGSGHSPSDPNTPDPLTNFIPIKAGEGFLVEPNTKHIYYADEKEPWHYVWVVFKGLSVTQYLRKSGLDRENIVYYPKDYSAQTSQKIRQHIYAILDDPNAEPAYIIGHFSLFFAALIENSRKQEQRFYPTIQKSEALANHYINQAVNYVNMNYAEIYSLDEISHFCHISQSHLGRIFRDYMNVSLQDYLIQYRMNKAKDLLLSTDHSVEEVAMEVGFHSEQNMLRAFKKAYGVSPANWRKHHLL